jgi:hypothetical protein
LKNSGPPTILRAVVSNQKTVKTFRGAFSFWRIDVCIFVF